MPSATAPPGTITGRRVSGSHTDGAHAGTLNKWVGADSSRCLFAGYQYESPLAGFWSTQTSTVKHRQQGLNLAGQHYTLHRHYDPTLMRFTSPDPIAAEFWNLHGYSGNNPAGFYDPDGLEPLDEFDWIIPPGFKEAAEVIQRYYDFYNHPEYQRGHSDGLGNGFHDSLRNLLKGLITGGQETSTVAWTHDYVRERSGFDTANEIMETRGVLPASAYTFMRWTVGDHGGEFVEIGLGRPVNHYMYGYRNGYATGNYAGQFLIMTSVGVVVRFGPGLAGEFAARCRGEVWVDPKILRFSQRTAGGRYESGGCLTL